MSLGLRLPHYKLKPSLDKQAFHFFFLINLFLIFYVFGCVRSLLLRACFLSLW